MKKIERKYLAHFVDANFNIDADAANATLDWYRIGQDLEAFAEELNPEVDVKKNILGVQSVNHKGYNVSSSVDTFYAYEDDAMFDHLKAISNNRSTGDACRSTRVEALLSVGANGTVTVAEAWREDCWIVPQSYGGDTAGVQIPFQIINCGNRVECTGTITNGVFTFTPKKA